MTARDDLLAALRDGNIWGDPGRSEQLADAYELEVRRAVAEELYDLDAGDCGCGCRCATFIDPDVPCPSCHGDGGTRLGQACHVCGLERTKPEDQQRPSIIPPQIYEGMLAQLLGVQPLRPCYTGVLAYLKDGER